MDAFCAKTVFAPDPLFDPSSASFPPKLVLPLTREYVLPICCAIDRVLNPTKYASLHHLPQHMTFNELLTAFMRRRKDA